MRIVRQSDGRLRVVAGPPHDRQGGLVPEAFDRAARADLITLPVDVPGTNCGNCRFFYGGSAAAQCRHPEVAMPVNARMCCAFWDNSGALRDWKENS